MPKQTNQEQQRLCSSLAVPLLEHPGAGQRSWNCLKIWEPFLFLVLTHNLRWPWLSYYSDLSRPGRVSRKSRDLRVSFYQFENLEPFGTKM